MPHVSFLYPMSIHYTGLVRCLTSLGTQGMENGTARGQAHLFQGATKGTKACLPCNTNSLTGPQCLWKFVFLVFLSHRDLLGPHLTMGSFRGRGMRKVRLMGCQ
jgi:hypothetical protein